MFKGKTKEQKGQKTQESTARVTWSQHPANKNSNKILFIKTGVPIMFSLGPLNKTPKLNKIMKKNQLIIKMEIKSHKILKIKSHSSIQHHQLHSGPMESISIDLVSTPSNMNHPNIQFSHHLYPTCVKTFEVFMDYQILRIIEILNEF